MISVVIPTYNREQTIIRSVESVLNQTYKDIEVIIVDDRSTDNTHKLMSEISDPRLSYIILDENKGANFARNRGIERTKGEYIAFQDSDDFWHPNKLEEQLAFLKAKSADVVFCAMKSFDGEEKVRIVPQGVQEGEISVDDLLFGNLISTQVILGKRECFLTEMFDQSFPRYQDWDLVIRLANKHKIMYQDVILVDRYTQGDSISKQPKKALISFQMILDKYDPLYQENKEAMLRIYNYQAKNAVLSGVKADEYINKMLKEKVTVKTLTKWLTNKLGIYPMIIKRKY